jgi:hypothetical protein
LKELKGHVGTAYFYLCGVCVTVQQLLCYNTVILPADNWSSSGELAQKQHQVTNFDDYDSISG